MMMTHSIACWQYGTVPYGTHAQRACLVYAGSEMTTKDLGPKESRKILPYVMNSLYSGTNTGSPMISRMSPRACGTPQVRATRHVLWQGTKQPYCAAHTQATGACMRTCTPFHSMQESGRPAWPCPTDRQAPAAQAPSSPIPTQSPTDDRPSFFIYQSVVCSTNTQPQSPMR